MFIPFSRTTFKEAAVRMAARLAKIHNRQHPGSPPLKDQDFLSESTDSLGRSLAGDVLRSWGIVSTAWQEDEWTWMAAGEEIELPSTVWRRPDAKRRMTEPPEEGWLQGEIDYAGGRVVAVLDTQQLDEIIDFIYPMAAGESADNAAPSIGENDLDLTPPSLPNDGPTRFACMFGYASAYKATGCVVKRNEAIAVMTKITRCTTRQAEAAYEALPFPELRNPPPAARAGSITHKMGDAAAPVDKVEVTRNA